MSLNDKIEWSKDKYYDGKDFNAVSLDEQALTPKFKNKIENIAEIWKEAIGFNGEYLVSNLGNVMSYKPTNWVSKEKKYKMLKPNLSKQGYLRLMTSMNSENKYYFVHRLVLEAFIPKPSENSIVNHLNSIKTDNRLENLEWCTQSENIKHAYKNGFKKPKLGVELSHTKLTNENVLEIKKLYRNGIRAIDIHRNYAFNCGYSTITQITSGKTWKHI